ncbi:hypothetical protein ElyMa_004048800 [Elysia marginata]|uniref:Uncharacterized protein n=1 Tax=Elysia marginata TaxID=1093978 RepID=A0AAV4G554_9GAST|nr:hypothetical protein ElyMa_004048800 [Elysia marginata]
MEQAVRRSCLFYQSIDQLVYHGHWSDTPQTSTVLVRHTTHFYRPGQTHHKLLPSWSDTPQVSSLQGGYQQQPYAHPAAVLTAQHSGHSGHSGHSTRASGHSRGHCLRSTYPVT